MRLFAAAVYTNGIPDKLGRIYLSLTERERQIVQSLPWFLESYHYLGGSDKYVAAIEETGAKIFMDSGAFSSFTQGVEIDFDAYCRFIKEHKDIILYEGKTCLASVLDDLKDPEITFKNQKRMEDAGIVPLPCFHYGEDERYLEYYVENYSYITLGGVAQSTPPQLRQWLDRVWSKYLTDEEGLPRVKVHGFGVTAFPLMMRYPWFSVDSSTWVQVGNVGNIILPFQKPIILAISYNSPMRKQAGKHFNTIAPIEQERIRQLIEENGFTVERLSTEYKARWVWNLWAQEQLSQRVLSTKNMAFTDYCEGLF